MQLSNLNLEKDYIICRFPNKAPYLSEVVAIYSTVKPARLPSANKCDHFLQLNMCSEENVMWHQTI